MFAFLRGKYSESLCLEGNIVDFFYHCVKVLHISVLKLNLYLQLFLYLNCVALCKTLVSMFARTKAITVCIN